MQFAVYPRFCSDLRVDGRTAKFGELERVTLLHAQKRRQPLSFQSMNTLRGPEAVLAISSPRDKKTKRETRISRRV